MIYGRILDVHIGNSAWYDFAKSASFDEASVPQGEYQKVEPNGTFEHYVRLDQHGKDITKALVRQYRKFIYDADDRVLNWSPWEGGHNRNLDARANDGELPNRGIIAIGVDIEYDIADERTRELVTQLVEWVSDWRHNGKVRFNVHGSESGTLAMPNKQGNWKEADAGCAAGWLLNNGLEQRAKGKRLTRVFGAGLGLTTVTFAICMGGRHETTGAEMNRLRVRSKPAVNSTVDKFVSRLQVGQVNGVKVTGANEITAMGSGKYTGNVGRSIELPLGDGWNRRQRGPSGWAGRGIISIPDRFQVTRQQGFMRRGVLKYRYMSDIREDTYRLADHQRIDGYGIFRAGQLTDVIPSTGWIVDTGSGNIQPPLGWFVKPARSGFGGELRFSRKNTNLSLGNDSFEPGSVWQSLSYTPYKVTKTT